jgi:hypothetical protein
MAFLASHDFVSSSEKRSGEKGAGFVGSRAQEAVQTVCEAVKL